MTEKLFIAIGVDGNLKLFDTAAEAEEAAIAMLQAATDGEINEDVANICCGEVTVTGRAVRTEVWLRHRRAQYDYGAEWQLLPIEQSVETHRMGCADHEDEDDDGDPCEGWGPAEWAKFGEPDCRTCKRWVGVGEEVK